MMMYILFGFLIVASIGAFCVRKQEKEAWNGGICKENSEPWFCVQVSSQGCRLYTTASRNEYVWISYAVDK